MKKFLPLFNSPLFDQELKGNRLSFDSQNLWRFLEVILFPEMPYQVKAYTEQVCLVTSPLYPSQSPLYTHVSFVSQTASVGDRPQMPSLSVFLQNIESCVKSKVPYLWGGNLPHGTDLVREVYPLPSPLDPLSGQVFDLRGVDCSGLLYWASYGATERNTSDLVKSGQAVQIAGASLQEIVGVLKPGMIIVWKGHVLVVTDKGIVESTPSTGVILRDPKKAMEEILQNKQPLNEWPSGALMRSDDEGFLERNASFVVRDLFPIL